MRETPEGRAIDHAIQVRFLEAELAQFEERMAAERAIERIHVGDEMAQLAVGVNEVGHRRLTARARTRAGAAGERTQLSSTERGSSRYRRYRASTYSGLARALESNVSMACMFARIVAAR